MDDYRKLATGYGRKARKEQSRSKKPALRRERVRPEPGKKTRKKNRKRWCGGHVGREHEGECVLDRRYCTEWYSLECRRCGRILDYWVRGFRRSPQPKWVVLEEERR